MTSLFILNSDDTIVMKHRAVKIIVFLFILFVLDRSVACFIKTGLERYYGIGQDADILLIGHSHMMKSCSKEALEKELGMKVAKYCREGVMVKDRYAMVEHFLSEQSDGSVPYVLYGVDPFMFSEGGLSLNSYKLFYPFMENPVMDDLVRSEVTEWHDYPIHKYIHSTRITDNMIYRSMRGWCGYWKSLQDGVINEQSWAAPRSWKRYMPEDKVILFRKTLDLLLERGCHVILVHPPLIESIEKSNPGDYRKMIDYYRELAENDPRIDFLDYGPQFSHRRELFEDPVHVNRLGEKLMTEALIKDLRKIMQRQ